MFGRRKISSDQPQPQFIVPIEECLAKSYKDGLGEIKKGRHVLDHCQIVGTVAQTLVSRLPDPLRETFFPAGSNLIAAAHDLGKISPTFQKKIYLSISKKDEMCLRILKGLKTIDSELESNWGGHSGVSQLSAANQKSGSYIPEILGIHHGFSPPVDSRNPLGDSFGGVLWEEERIRFINSLKGRLSTRFPNVLNDLQARVLAGLTTISDWIGSGTFFEDPDQGWEDKIEKSLDQAGFIIPDIERGLTFQEIFGFAPRAIQSVMFDQVTGPGLYILEAPMGEGKTEAALYSAYQVLTQRKATGIYFALPTQLTSNKVHARVSSFLSKIVKSNAQVSHVPLVYSQSWLAEREMGEEGRPGHSWFSGKRGILAPFAVGTIDQALMSVLNVKHAFIRTFGLLGKVVILDEVHSYDSYTGTILDRLIEDLLNLQCTVILLSATLTYERKMTFIGGGVENPSYPLLSSRTEGKTKEMGCAAVSSANVEIVHSSDSDAMEEALRRAEEGQQVVWIENTVKEAQNVFQKLSSRAAELSLECGLLHARFIRQDREKNEKQWVGLFGKEGQNKRQERGRILIGTQVLEQSLDLDSDFMVLKFCPTDMIFQRLGRLWRHSENSRISGASRTAWIVSPNLEKSIASLGRDFGPSFRVYSPYVLCRSLEVWNGVSSITLPEDIRRMIEATYSARKESGNMARLLGDLERECSILRQHALVGLSRGTKVNREEWVPTRFGERQFVDVLLLKKYVYDTKREEATLSFAGEDTPLVIPRNSRVLSLDLRKSVSVRLMKQMVRVPVEMAPPPVARKHLAGLEEYLYLGDERLEEPSLRLGIIDSSDEVREGVGGTQNPKYRIFYDSRMGYFTKKK